LKEWHFAHQSKDVHLETKKACEYSFAVSARLMIRQLAMDELKFRTPEYSISIEAYSERSNKSNRVSLPVTEERQLIVTKPEVDAKFSETNVDILGYVDSVPFVVYVTYRDRQVPSVINPPNTEKCGVVAIDIGGLPTLFEKEREGRYIEVLRKFIEENTEGKSWIYHPRAAKARKEAKAQMEQWLSQQKAYHPKPRTKPAVDISFPMSRSKPEAFVPAKRKVQHYQCVMCNAYWKSISPHCKKCDTHLFAKVVNGVASET
jgi:hypothetical protein